MSTLHARSCTHRYRPVACDRVCAGELRYAAAARVRFPCVYARPHRALAQASACGSRDYDRSIEESEAASARATRSSSARMTL